MQLDSEIEHHHSSPANQPATGYNENLFKAQTLKGRKEAAKDGKHALTSLIRYKSCEEVADPSPLADESGPHGYADMKISCDHNLNECGCKIASFSDPFHRFEMVKEESELYTDKAVTVIETPKTIVFLKEGSYHIVKDICIDEGVYLFDKVSVEKATESEKIINHSVRDDRNLTNGYSALDGLKSSNINEQSLSAVENEDDKLHSFDSILGGTCNTVDDHVSDEKTPKSLVALQEVEWMSLLDTVSVEKAAEDKKNYNFKHSVKDERNLANEYTISDGLKLSDINEKSLSSDENDDAKLCAFEKLLEEGDRFHTVDECVSNMSDEKGPKNLVVLQEVERGQLPGHVLDVDREGPKRRSFRCYLEEDGFKFDTADGVINEGSDEKNIAAAKLLLFQEFDGGHSQEDLSCCDSKDDQLQCVNSDSTQLQSIDGSSDHPGSVDGKSNWENYQILYVRSQGVVDEADPTSSVLRSALEEHKQVTSTKDFSPSGKVEDRTVAFDVDTEPPANRTRNERKGTAEAQQSSQTKSATVLKEASNDGMTASKRTSLCHYGNADSSLSGPTFLSGSVVYSGQIPYSGSISLRSDSSTTSTRSFAFPILQSEWSSSPVKMAKADHRHFRKHRGWKSGLLCCRF